MGNATTKDYPKNISVGTNSRKTRWDGPGLPAPPGKPILISGTDETQPDVVAIRWERSPSNGGSAIVGYLVEHRRLGSTHWVRSSPGLCAFPELTLSGLEPGWRYQFRVRAQNAVGLSRPSEISEPLTVTLQRAAAACAPYFDLELKDTTALENEQAEFIAQFSGTPLPKISWFKDGFEIFSSRRTRINTDNGKSVLLIHQTALNDEGEIKCTATNRAGHVATRAKLILEASPRIRLPRQYEDGLLFEQDETIRLKVSLAGKPPPTVTWYHNGELISKDARHVFEVMDGESVLKIPDAKRNDRGEYTVKATNKLGEDVASFLVTVTDRPAAPGKVNVAMTLGRSVTLSWKEPEDDGGCKIGTYIIEYYRIGWEVWLKATTSRCTSATLTELIEGSEYKFRVKAENPYGVSDPSEESDVIFIPDLKRRIVTPSLNEKSQSHREISRSRGDKCEVSFTTPAQRTRSLTREEAKTRDVESGDRFGYDERSASTQRLAMPISTLDRPSRADSRVTFAPDTLEKEVSPPIPPARSRDHASTKQQVSLGNYADRSNTAADTRDKQDIIKRERTMSPKPTVTVSSPVEEDFKPRSIPTTKERRSLSPLSMPRIQEPQREENRTTASHYFSSSLNSNLRRQTAITNESMLPSPQNSLQLQKMSREDDEDALHGSSEFMLVLYPEDEMQEENVTVTNGTSHETRIKSTSSKQDMIELMEEESDLIPPPMSLSLPELFSARHQVVEVMRSAVSSTELLHERAMERFYRAVAAEEASEIAKRKTQLERQTGELALLNDESVRRSSLRRRLSNSGVTTQNLIVSWQAKKDRRRSSEGQTEAAPKTMKLLSPALLSDVEARSDPNLPSETTMADSWRRSDENESLERLRRWHETNVPLLEEVQEEKSIRADDAEGMVASISVNRAKEVEEEEIISIETSEESSEEISSADSEDLKLLKSRILARQVMDEEDTYHPRGRSVPHIEPQLPQISHNRMTSLEIPPVRAVTPVSLNNVVPKSILKKPKEEIPPDNFGRSIAPEKPIRTISPQPYERENVEKMNIDIGETITDFSSMSEVLKTPPMSESDTDSILSAAEAAKNRRMQSKLRSMTPDEEAAETEARMAVVNQYTEIVREYASNDSRHGSAASSRRSSISEDQADQRHRVHEKLAPKLIDKQEQDEISKSKIKNKNKVEQQTKNNQAPAVTKKESANSRSTTPARDTTTAKRVSRQTSRDQSPAARRKERTTGASSRSSSKTRNRTPSLERNNRSLAKNDLNEQGSRRSKIPSGSSSRSSSRSNSRERFGKTASVKSKVEKLQKALESNKYRAMKKESEVTKEIAGKSTSERTDGKQLALEAKNTVRSTVDYITDLTLLIAAMYVYFFKKETLAVPFIVLLLYRRIQEEIHGWMPRRWWRSTKKP